MTRSREKRILLKTDLKYIRSTLCAVGFDQTTREKTQWRPPDHCSQPDDDQPRAVRQRTVRRHIRFRHRRRGPRRNLGNSEQLRDPGRRRRVPKR